jgi:DNA-binding CsgD family transcriptional regulator
MLLADETKVNVPFRCTITHRIGLYKCCAAPKIKSMLNLSKYDRVVSHIYEAALVPSHWDIALTSLIDFFAPREWHVAFVVWERLEPATGRFIGSAGVHPLAQQAYLEHFAGRHEWSIRGHQLPLGKVVLSDELIDRNLFKESKFYKNFLGPWGYELALVGMLDRQDTDHMGICCPGPPDRDPGELREAITLLTPHIQRAARISRRIGEADMRAATASDLLNSSPYSVIALGPDLELLMANSRGQALLDQSSGMTIKHGRLKLDDAATAKRLATMAAGRSKEHSIAFTAAGMNGGELLMTAIAVSAQHGENFASSAGGTALMLVGGQRIAISDSAIEALQHGFGLTAAEARLAGFLIQGSGVRGYAEDRGVSQEAGKYLLKGIYAKTGLSNQTELVAMLREVPLGWGKPLTPALPSQD